MMNLARDRIVVGTWFHRRFVAFRGVYWVSCQEGGRMIRRIVMGFVLAAASGCGASQASYLSDSIPASNVTQCESLCASANMEMTSLVIVANETGCVCERPDSPGGTAAAAGGAAQLVLERRRAQNNANNNTPTGNVGSRL